MGSLQDYRSRQRGGEDGASEETPESAPVILVEKSVVSTGTAKAGEDFDVTVTLKNTSKTKSVQNMVASITVPSADFELKNNSNTIFIDKLGAEKQQIYRSHFMSEKARLMEIIPLKWH